MRIILFLLFFISAFSSAQDNKTTQMDPYIQNKGKASPVVRPEDKVKIIHSDEFKKDTKYEGNQYMVGHVQIEHQGSILYADEVILYNDQSLVKAIGNAKLQNADGSVITAHEMEYNGVTQKGVAKKDVVLTDPKQTIKTDILYYDRLANQAYFNTGGTISDAQNVMYTKSATYFLNTKMIDFVGNVKIDSPDYIIEGPNIKQNQNTKVAEFFGPTTITNRANPKNRIYTERGTYKMETKEAFLNKNSKIFYNDKILTGDDMYFNNITGFGKATGNVTLDDPIERRYIKGGYGEIFQKKDSAMMTKGPYAVKIMEKDSVYFAAEKILSYQRPDSADITKKKSFLRAFKKARVFKSNAQGRADSIAFNETDGIMHMYTDPILWSGEKQVTGDKVEAYFNTQSENIDSLKVIGNAFAISKVDSLNLKDEFNQVKGKFMTVYYQNNEIKEARVVGNAQSIVFVDDVDQETKQPKRIGITISTCGIIGALFEESGLQIVSCSIGAVADTYPMSKIEPEKRKFSDFNWNTKDRIRKWQDILVDSPNYEEIKYTADNELFDQAQSAIDREKAKEEAKKPKRVKK
ncbi:OstA-like protein [Chryseobacterium vrystaatense]|uniref:Organic solvent tolerance protein OstA n=1 Tax=Chryseobacterium vrystaatense TaxID=307480 RepID=A0A1M5PJA7_9FLAO|nr:OstA-like protein [Chryseobacterium vrystaatense]KFF24677.1 organic solvent tolerance protein OstA [Chryseobacterium vrystaatense]SHH01569.1 OstA-like protein [Chryseobacterium vrystaatense]